MEQVEVYVEKMDEGEVDSKEVVLSHGDYIIDSDIQMGKCYGSGPCASVRVHHKDFSYEICLEVKKVNGNLIISVFESDYEKGLKNKTIEEMKGLNHLFQAFKTLGNYLK